MKIPRKNQQMDFDDSIQRNAINITFLVRTWWSLPEEGQKERICELLRALAPRSIHVPLWAAEATFYLKSQVRIHARKDFPRGSSRILLPRVLMSYWEPWHLVVYMSLHRRLRQPSTLKVKPGSKRGRIFLEALHGSCFHEYKKNLSFK